MSRTRRRVLLTLAFLLVLLSLATVVLVRDARNRPADPRYASQVAFDAGELAWASAGSIRVSDGQVVEIGDGLDRWVVSEVGVFFTTDEPDEGVGYLPAARLYFTDGTGEPTFTGHSIDPLSLNASPDGRYVSYVETTSGPTSDDQPWSTTLVVDVRDHTVIVKESASIATSLTEDAVALFSELEGDTRGGAAFLEGDQALVRGPGFEDFVVDLRSGDRAPLPDSGGFSYPGSPTSPDQQHSFLTGDDGRPHVVSAVRLNPSHLPFTGHEVHLAIPPTAELLGWRSDDLFHGVDDGFLLLCSVEQATCQTLETAVDEDFSLASRIFAGELEGHTNAERPLTLE